MRNQRPCFLWKAGSFFIPLGRATKVMGIVNVTEDSFSNDGVLKHNDRNFVDASIRQSERMVQDGADLIDIGAESSRPGSKPISEDEEIARVIPVIKKLVKKINVPVSVDTYKPRVAEKALDCGASIINTIYGISPDKVLLKAAARAKAGLVLMHMRGTPQTMQKNTVYRNLIPEIIAMLQRSKEICLESGIKSDRIVIDPGIGFGKSAEQNLTIIRQLIDFHALKQPILVGVSRKSFIGKILNADVGKRLEGSLAAACCAVLNGAHIIRAHDVRETRQAVDVVDAIIKEKIKL